MGAPASLSPVRKNEREEKELPSKERENERFQHERLQGVYCSYRFIPLTPCRAQILAGADNAFNLTLHLFMITT